MKLSKLLYKKHLIGLSIYLSTNVIAMETVILPTTEIQPSKIEISPKLPFTFLSALRMEYEVDYDAVAFDTVMRDGLNASLTKDIPTAITCFLEASRYRKIGVFSTLANAYKANGQHLEAFKWIIWAYQESLLGSTKGTFSFQEKYIDTDFLKEIKILSDCKKINGSCVKKGHKKHISDFIQKIETNGIGYIKSWTKEMMSTAYDKHPSSLEPYLTPDECAEKIYLFKSYDELLLKMIVNNKFKNKTEKDYVTFKIDHFAAMNNISPIAYLDLGLSYLKGEGTEANSEEAMRWLFKASEANLPLAFYNLSRCYIKGLGTEIDYQKARIFAEKGADLRDGGSYNNLGCIYLEGLGVSPSTETAKVYFEKAIDCGDNFAILGYTNILYIERDPKSFEWAKKGLSAGFTQCNFVIGMCYAIGLEVPQDVKYGLELATNSIDSIKKYDNNYAIRALSQIIDRYYLLKVTKNQVFDHDIINHEIKRLKTKLNTLYTEKDTAINSYNEAFYDLFEGNTYDARNKLIQAYLQGISEAGELLKELFEIIKIQEEDFKTEEETLTSQETNNNGLCNSPPVLIIENITEPQFPSTNPEPFINYDMERREKIKNQKEEELIRKEKLQIRKEEKKKKSLEKIQRKLLEMTEFGKLESLQPREPREIEFVFDSSSTGQFVKEKFTNLLSEENSKLADIMNDIKYGYKTNKVHPLTGSLKGYLARKINDKDRLVYRWVGPGQMEIRSCEGHYGD